MLISGKGTLKEKSGIISVQLMLSWQERLTRLGEDH
jgi:hypothetical protein